MIGLILAFVALSFGLASITVLGIGYINVLRIRKAKREIRNRGWYWNE